MKLIFAGTPQNAAHTLLALLAAGHEIVGVITRPDAPVGRKQVLTASPVAMLAESRGLPLIKTKRISSDQITTIREWDADLGVVVAFGSIFSREVLDLPKSGWINIHYSLLPNWPGAAPVQNSILAGDENTGITIFCLDEGIDTGLVIEQKSTNIFENETSGELLERLTVLGADCLIEVLSDFESKYSQAQKQETISNTRNAIKPTRESAKIDWSAAASEVHDLVRAMNPEPMAWCLFDENPIRVLNTLVHLNLQESIELNEPGTVFVFEKKIFVSCGKGSTLELVKIQPAGKTPMGAIDWFNGLLEKNVVLS